MKPRLLAIVLGTLLPALASAMEIRVAGKQLIMSGRLAGDELAKLRDIVPANPQIDTVILRDAPGGNVYTAQRLGEMIGERGWRTAVSGSCLSACVLIFLGGRERHFADGKPGNVTYIAIHTPIYSADGGQTWPPPRTPLPREQGPMIYWMMERVGDKGDRALLERGIGNDHPDGFMYFFDHVRHRRPDGISVFQCKGPEKKKVADCEKIPGKNALQAGLVTSEEIIRVEP
jgi:hypothetical protein